MEVLQFLTLIIGNVINLAGEENAFNISNGGNWTIDNGQPFHLLCYGSNPTWNPPLSSRTTVNDTSGASVLTVMNPTSSDTGLYKCHQKDLDVFTSVYIFVKGASHIFIPADLPYILFYDNDINVRVPCRVTDPDARVSLFNAAGEVIQNPSDYDPRSGFILHDYNKYVNTSVNCLATYNGMNQSISYNFRKTYIPRPRITPMNDILAYEGDSINLTCEAYRSKFEDWSMKWYHTLYEVPKESIPCKRTKRNSRMCTIEIHIKSAEKFHTGAFSCVIQNNDSRSLNASRLVKIFGKNESYLEIKMEDVATASVHKNATIAANYEGLPRLPKFHWYEPHGKEIMNSKKYKVTSSSNQVILYINDLSVRDSGTYTLVGRAGNSTEIKKVFLKVEGPPLMNLEGDHMVFVHSESYDFYCDVQSFPEANVTWSFQNCTLPENCSTQVLEAISHVRNETLKMKFVAFTSGKLICEVKNTYGHKNHSIDIKVAERIFPHFTKDEEKNLKVSQGASIQLKCQFFGMPQPQIHWFKDKECKSLLMKAFVNVSSIFQKEESIIELPYDNSNVTFSNGNQIMTIEYTKIEDSGNYSCKVNNSDGEIQRWTLLEVSNTVRKPVRNTEIISTISLVLALLLLAVIYLIWRIRREKRKRFTLTAKDITEFREGDLANINPDLEIDEQAYMLPYQKNMEFPLEKLKFDKEIGNGAFGRVLKAQAYGIRECEEFTTVAVKMVKSHSEVQHLKSLMSELKILMYIGNHLNVLNVLGACTTNLMKGELFVILEYCKLGNIRGYLQCHRESFVNQIDPQTNLIDFNITNNNLNEERYVSMDPNGSLNFPQNNTYYCSKDETNESNFTEETCLSSAEDSSSIETWRPEWNIHYKWDANEKKCEDLSTKDLLSWSYQVALGMEYLSHHKVVHADLAARNILLTEDHIVKICDFGLSRQLYGNIDYLKKGKDPLPIKWMAIESIEDRIFSTKSDVWSYGVVLWEFFSLAKAPYAGMDVNETFLKKLRTGYRMEKPEFCPTEIYQLLLRCWSTKPHERPEFSSIVERVGVMLDNDLIVKYKELNLPYVNRNCMCKTYNDYVNINKVKKAASTSQDMYINMGPEINGEIHANSRVPSNELKNMPPMKQCEYIPMLGSDGYLPMTK